MKKGLRREDEKAKKIRSLEKETYKKGKFRLHELRTTIDCGHDFEHVKRIKRIKSERGQSEMQN